MLRVESLNYNKNKDYIEKHFGQLLLDSYNYDCSNYKQKEVRDVQSIFSSLQTDEIYVVFRHSKFIGFFINPVINNQISVKVFRFSFACPMSSRSLMKCAFIRSVGYYINNQEDISEVYFSVWHPALTHVLRAIIPKLSIDNITSDYIICHYKFNENEIPKLVLILTKYLGTDEIDINNFDVVL